MRDLDRILEIARQELKRQRKEHIIASAAKSEEDEQADDEAAEQQPQEARRTETDGEIETETRDTAQSEDYFPPARGPVKSRLGPGYGHGQDDEAYDSTSSEVESINVNEHEHEHDSDSDTPIGLELIKLDMEEVPVQLIELIHDSVAKLSLKGNLLAQLPTEFRSMDRLTYLDVSHNDFYSFPQVLCECRALEILDISGNYLSALPEHLGSLTSTLKVLSLSHNRFEYLAPSIAELDDLRFVELDGNPLIMPPAQFVSDHIESEDWTDVLKEYLISNQRIITQRLADQRRTGDSTLPASGNANVTPPSPHSPYESHESHQLQSSGEADGTQEACRQQHTPPHSPSHQSPSSHASSQPQGHTARSELPLHERIRSAPEGSHLSSRAAKRMGFVVKKRTPASGAGGRSHTNSNANTTNNNDNSSGVRPSEHEQHHHHHHHHHHHQQQQQQQPGSGSPPIPPPKDNQGGSPNITQQPSMGGAAPQRLNVHPGSHSQSHSRTNSHEPANFDQQDDNTGGAGSGASSIGIGMLEPAVTANVTPAIAPSPPPSTSTTLESDHKQSHSHHHHSHSQYNHSRTSSQSQPSGHHRQGSQSTSPGAAITSVATASTDYMPFPTIDTSSPSGDIGSSGQESSPLSSSSQPTSAGSNDTGASLSLRNVNTTVSNSSASGNVSARGSPHADDDNVISFPSSGSNSGAIPASAPSPGPAPRSRRGTLSSGGAPPMPGSSLPPPVPVTAAYLEPSAGAYFRRLSTLPEERLEYEDGSKSYSSSTLTGGNQTMSDKSGSTAAASLASLRHPGQRKPSVSGQHYAGATAGTYSYHRSSGALNATNANTGAAGSTVGSNAPGLAGTGQYGSGENGQSVPAFLPNKQHCLNCARKILFAAHEFHEIVRRCSGFCTDKVVTSRLNALLVTSRSVLPDLVMALESTEHTESMLSPRLNEENESPSTANSANATANANDETDKSSPSQGEKHLVATVARCVDAMKDLAEFFKDNLNVLAMCIDIKFLRTMTMVTFTSLSEVNNAWNDISLLLQQQDSPYGVHRTESSSMLGLGVSHTDMPGGLGATSNAGQMGVASAAEHDTDVEEFISADEQLYDRIYYAVNAAQTVLGQLTNAISRASAQTTTSPEATESSTTDYERDTMSMSSKVKDLASACVPCGEITQRLRSRMDELRDTGGVDRRGFWDDTNTFLKTVIGILGNTKQAMNDLPTLGDARPSLATLTKLAKEIPYLLEMSSYRFEPHGQTTTTTPGSGVDSDVSSGFSGSHATGNLGSGPHSGTMAPVSEPMPATPLTAVLGQAAQSVMSPSYNATNYFSSFV